MPRGSALKYVKPAIGLLLLGLLSWIILAKQGGLQASRDRQARSLALAATPVEKLGARYVLAQAPYSGRKSAEAGAGLAAMDAMLRRRGWLHGREASGQPMAWCPAIGKGAFFRHGWVWICDAQGDVLKTVWFEPDLKADGKLEFSDEGTQLRLRADGWRHWLTLELCGGPDFICGFDTFPASAPAFSLPAPVSGPAQTR